MNLKSLHCIFAAYRSPEQYRSIGVMFDGDDFEWNLTVSLWWWDWQWTRQRTA